MTVIETYKKEWLRLEDVISFRLSESQWIVANVKGIGEVYVARVRVQNVDTSLQRDILIRILIDWNELPPEKQCQRLHDLANSVPHAPTCHLVMQAFLTNFILQARRIIKYHSGYPVKIAENGEFVTVCGDAPCEPAQPEVRERAEDNLGLIIPLSDVDLVEIRKHGYCSCFHNSFVTADDFIQRDLSPANYK